MKRILIAVLSLAITLMILPIQPVLAEENSQSFYVEEIETRDPYTKKWIIHDGEVEVELEQNLLTFEAICDHTVLNYEVEELAIPNTSPNWSTGAYVQYEIPWKQTAAATAAVIALLLGASVSEASDIQTAIETGLTGAPSFWATYTQYQSVESYYSSYYNTYYHKCANYYRSVYKNSVAASNRKWGPSNGGWFDPIRPY